MSDQPQGRGRARARGRARGAAGDGGPRPGGGGQGHPQSQGAVPRVGNWGQQQQPYQAQGGSASFQGGPGGPPQQAGRGGSYGRGRQPQGGGGSYTQSQGRGQPAYQQAPPPSQSAWGQRSGGAPRQDAPPKSTWGPRTAPESQSQFSSAGRASIAHSSGDASSIEGQEIVGSGSGSGNGNTGIRRGNVRGRRQLHETIHTRPATNTTKLGSHGTKIALFANYFKLERTTKFTLYQYRVDFTPEEDRTNVKKALFRRAVREYFSGYIFDGTVMYSSIKKDVPELYVKDERNLENPDPYQVKIRFVQQVDFGENYIQVFNILMRKCLMHLKLQLVGRDYYDPQAAISLDSFRLHLWPGYVTSIRQHDFDILMCAEISHKVMRQDTAYDVYAECAQSRRPREEFQNKMIGSVVLTPYNNRTYRIDDVDFTKSPDSTFGMRDGSQISYREYFKNRYNQDCGSSQQPMLVSRAKRRELRVGMSETIYLVPSLCSLTGLTDAQRANFQMMRALADHTRMGPQQRVVKLKEFSNRLLRNAEAMEDLKNWDMKLANNIIQFSGRILPPEVIVAGNSTKYSAGMQADWTQEIRSKPMTLMKTLNEWFIVVPSKSMRNLNAFTEALQRTSKGMQYRISQPKIKQISDDRIGSYMQAIDEVLATRAEMVMLVVPNNNSDRYAALKKRCCVDKAILSQVVVQRSVESRGVMSIATKIVIQMNAKLGGVPWSVPIPVRSLMVVGFDVCHDTSNKSRSFGACVATLSQNCGQYFSTVTPHTSGEELSNDFGLSLIKCCHAYKQLNGNYPESIVIYRDGVGEGQYVYVIEHELKNIRKELLKIYECEEKIKLVFIIVSKRINTRIFQADMNRRDTFENPAPGTVVDNTITLPERYDFFIVSQCVRQGTVSPTSYNIIYDTLNLTPDQIQRLTYKLTHMYFNWSGTVRVPAPCQYAHKLAFLVGQYLHRNPNPALENCLYYL